MNMQDGLEVEMSKRIVVTWCSDSLYWYAKFLGTEFVVKREEEDRYWVREPNDYGLLNFILKKDSREV